MEAIKSRTTSIALITLGVGLMALALLTGRKSAAGWSIIPVGLVSLYLGARGWRGEPKPVFMLIAGCIAAIIAISANVGSLGMNPILANIFGLIILVSIVVVYLVPRAKQRLKL